MMRVPLHRPTLTLRRRYTAIGWLTAASCAGFAASSTVQAAEGRDSRTLEEIIVTAQKRAQDVQDVPISIAVIGADEISQRGLVNAEDYLRGIPGVNQMDHSAGQSIIIRGIESATTGQNFGSGMTNATYFGETPTTNAAGLFGGANVDIKLVDIERVEVLRGPQGTGFGNASMGGAVRTIPASPKLGSAEFKAGVGYSMTSGSGGDNYNIQAAGNIPLVADKLAVRAVGYQYQDSGFYRNVAGSNTAFQALAAAPYGALSSAANEDEVGAYYARGGRIAALFQATDALSFTLSYLKQKTERDGIALSNGGDYEQSLLRVAPEHVVDGQNAGFYHADIDIANAVMEYDFGWASLLASYSYVDSGSVSAIPLTSYGTNWPVSQFADSRHREDVGEIRLVTPQHGRWSFLAGLYAEDVEDHALANNKWHGTPATNVITPGAIDLGSYPDDRTLKQLAGFGEVSWEFVDALTLTGGVRAYEYDRTYKVHASGGFYGAAGVHREEEQEDSGATYRANLSYEPADDILLYAGWAQGFRLGRLQAGLPPVCDGNNDGLVDGTSVTLDSTRQLGSDEVDSYEIGGKFVLLDRRVTISADVFRMEWSGMPVRVRSPVTTAQCGAGFSYFVNAGDAVSEGVEFQTSFQVTDLLRIDAGGSWLDAIVKEAPAAIGVADGNRLPGSPEFNANLGVQYQFEVGRYGLLVRADSIYVGSFYGNLLESPNTEAGDYVKLDTSARLEMGSLNLSLFVHNVTDEDAFSYRGDSGAVGAFYGYRLRPRTFGLQLDYSF